jgi:hypothetical protein
VVSAASLLARLSPMVSNTSRSYHLMIDKN